MPLLLLKEQIPLLSKTEITIKKLQKKEVELFTRAEANRNRYKAFNEEFEGDLQRVYQNKQVRALAVPNLDKTIKGVSNQVNTLQNSLKDIESKVLHLQKITETRLKDESLNINKEVDKVLEINKNEIQNIVAEFKNRIELSLKQQEEVYKEVKSGKGDLRKEKGIDKDKLIEDIHNITSARIDAYIEKMKIGYEKDISELHKVNVYILEILKNINYYKFSINFKYFMLFIL